MQEISTKREEEPKQSNTRERYVWKDGIRRPDRPMDFYLDEVLDKLAQNQVVVVQAETGVGKTSRIPQAILDSDPTAKIYMTQPRRPAVRMNAKYIADEKKQKLGEDVDFTLKDVSGELAGGRRANTSSRLELLIDESLTNRILRDKKLPDGIIIVDEAHERSVNIDLLLFLIRTYLPNSPNTKILITSATIDTEKFKKYFEYSPEELTEGATRDFVAEPVIAYNETLFPVETKHVYLNQGEHHSPKAIDTAINVFEQFLVGKGLFNQPPDRVVQPLSIPPAKQGGKREVVSEGTVLVFLPGKEDIQTGVERLTEYAAKAGCLDHLECLSMYRGVDDSEKNAVEAPIRKGVLRVVFTTEILKSSVTPPQTVGVIDSFQVKRNVENEFGVSVLQKISQSGAQADQAKGRTGRECPGFYIPILFHGEDSRMSRTSHEYWPVPAILQEGIISVTLKLAAVGMDIRTAKLLDRPDDAKIARSVYRLQSIDALDEEGKITPFGRELLRFSLSPEHARSLFEAKEQGVQPETMIALATVAEEGTFFLPARSNKEIVQSEEQVATALKLHITKKWAYELRYAVSGNADSKEQFVQKFNDAQKKEWGKVRLQFTHAQLENMVFPRYFDSDQANKLILNAEHLQKYTLDELLSEYLREKVSTQLFRLQWEYPVSQEQLQKKLNEVKKLLNTEITKHDGAPLAMRFDPDVLSSLPFPLDYQTLKSFDLKNALQFQTENVDDDFIESFHMRYEKGYFKIKTATRDTSRPFTFFKDVFCEELSSRDDNEYDYRKQLAAGQWKQFSLDGAGAATNSDFVACVNAYREYRKAKRQLNDFEMRLWCQANSLNYLKMKGVDQRVGFLLDETKGTSLDVQSPPSQDRVFSPDSLTKAMLAGLVENISFDGAGPRASSIKVSSNSAMGDKRTFLFGGIRKSELKQRGSSNDIYFAELCAPIEIPWLHEVSPQLCAEKRVDSSAYVSWNGKVTFEYEKSYFGYRYDTQTREASGKVAEIALATFIFNGRIAHPDHEQNKQKIAEVESLLVRGKRAQKLDSLVIDWYASQLVGQTKSSEVTTVNLQLTPSALSEILGFDYESFKEKTLLNTPSTLTVSGVVCPVLYFTAEPKKDTQRFYEQQVTIPEEVVSKLRFDNLPKPVVGFMLTVNVKIDDKYEDVKAIVSKKEELEELQKWVEHSRLEAVWDAFVASKGRAIQKVYPDNYYVYEGPSKKVVTVDKADRLPLSQLPQSEVWDTRTQAKTYYYFADAKEKNGTVEYSILLFKDETEYSEHKARIDQQKAEFLAVEQSKKEKEALEVKVKQLVGEVQALLSQLKPEHHLQYGLTADHVDSSYYAAEDISFFKRLELVKRKVGLGYVGVRVENGDWAVAEEKLVELKTLLVAAQHRFENQTNLTQPLTATFLGPEANFTREGYTIPVLVGSMEDGYGSAIYLGMRQSKENEKWYLLNRNDSGSWSSYSGSYSSKFLAGFGSPALLLSAVQAQFSQYPHRFTKENNQVDVATPEQLRRSRFEDLIKRQREHQGVFTGYRYADSQEPWELMYIKMDPAKDWWELRGIDLTTGELQQPKTFNNSSQFRGISSLSDMQERMTLLADSSFVRRTDGGIVSGRFAPGETIEKGLQRIGDRVGRSPSPVAAPQPPVRQPERIVEAPRMASAPVYIPPYREPVPIVKEAIPLEKLKIYTYLQSRDLPLSTLLTVVDSGKDTKQLRDGLEWRAAFVRSLLTTPEGFSHIITGTWNGGALTAVLPELQRALKGWINEYQQQSNTLSSFDQTAIEELQQAQDTLNYVLPIRSFIYKNRSLITDFVGSDPELNQAFNAQLLQYLKRNSVSVLDDPQNHEQIVLEVADEFTSV